LRLTKKPSEEQVSDRRVQKTRKRPHEALMALLHEKRYDCREGNSGSCERRPIDLLHSFPRQGRPAGERNAGEASLNADGKNAAFHIRGRAVGLVQPSHLRAHRPGTTSWKALDWISWPGHPSRTPSEGGRRADLRPYEERCARPTKPTRPNSGGSPRPACRVHVRSGAELVG
jgi:hypothetical protein